MSDWSLQQWTEQLKSTDEAARHEAAAMLGEHRGGEAVGPLLRASVREAGLWHTTTRGIPHEPDHRPLCRTALTALQKMAPYQVPQTIADIKAWRAWKAAPAASRGERPERRRTAIGALLASMANDERGAFDPAYGARAAWTLGEIGWTLQTWDHFLPRIPNWASFVTYPAEKQGPVPRPLIAYMAETGDTAEAALAAVRELRALVGVELTELLDALRQRREQGEPSDIGSLQKEIIGTLGRISYAEGGRAILACFQEGWPDLHWETATALGKLKVREAVPLLQRRLLTAQGALRARIACALGEIGEKTADRVLIGLLNDPDASVRTQAARALGRLGATERRDRLFQSLLDDDETVRFTVGTALGMLGDARTVPFLLRAVREGDLGTQREARQALEKLDRGALTALVQLLRSGEPPYRADAAQRIGELKDPRAVRYLIPSLLVEDCQQEVANALLQIGEPSVEPLVQYLKNEDPNLEGNSPALQEHAARVLGKLRDPRAVPPLVALLQKTSTPARLREEAARVLGKLGDAAAADALIQAVRPQSGTTVAIRAEAARALGLLRVVRALPDLKAALDHRDTDDTLRNYTIEALGNLGDPAAVDVLLKELQSFRRGGRASVIQALGKLGDPRAIPQLLEIADEQPVTYLNGFALRALAQLGEASIIASILQERSFHPELDRALQVLGDRALPHLLTELRAGRRADVRALAASALGDLGRADTMNALIQALQDPSEPVQKAAARALARLHAGAKSTAATISA